MLDKPFEDDGRALTGRALALAAALDWPGAAEQRRRRARRRASSASRRARMRRSRAPASTCSRASPTRRSRWPRRRRRARTSPPRVRYVIGRGLLAAGKKDAGLGGDQALPGRTIRPTRARSSWSRRGGREPALAPAAARRSAGRALLRHARARPAAAARPTASASTGRSPGASSRSSPTPGPGSWSSSRPARVLRDDGETERGRGVAGGAAARRRARRPRWRKKGARNMFPDAKLKTLPPLLARQQARAVPRAQERLAAPGRGHDHRARRRRLLPGAERLDRQLPEAQGRIRDVREEPGARRSERRWYREAERSATSLCSRQILGPVAPVGLHGRFGIRSRRARLSASGPRGIAPQVPRPEPGRREVLSRTSRGNRCRCGTSASRGCSRSDAGAVGGDLGDQREALADAPDEPERQPDHPRPHLVRAGAGPQLQSRLGRNDDLVAADVDADSSGTVAYVTCIAAPLDEIQRNPAAGPIASLNRLQGTRRSCTFTWPSRPAVVMRLPAAARSACRPPPPVRSGRGAGRPPARAAAA